MPQTKQVVVFDTAFYHTIPPVAYRYAIPSIYYEKYKIRKYGFHGTSHKYVSKKASEYLNKNLFDLKMITCHLGNGSSITAIKNGIPIDTSMGFTPLEGVIMGTRCGSLDPAIVPFIMENDGLSSSEVTDMMNKRSGLLALSQVSADLRDIEKEYDNGNKNAELAYNSFAYNIKKYIGYYTAIMGGIDVLVFTAGIGENSSRMRKLITDNLEILGIKIDDTKNINKEIDISSIDSKVKVLVIPTNEEYMIALETKKVVEENTHYIIEK